MRALDSHVEKFLITIHFIFFIEKMVFVVKIWSKYLQILCPAIEPASSSLTVEHSLTTLSRSSLSEKHQHNNYVMPFYQKKSSVLTAFYSVVKRDIFHLDSGELNYSVQDTFTILALKCAINLFNCLSVIACCFWHVFYLPPFQLKQ